MSAEAPSREEIANAEIHASETPVAYKPRDMLGRRVLVVDDNASLRDLLRLYLVDAGFDILDVGDGDSALEVAWPERVDVVLLDVMLPGRSGITVFREIRARSALPVVFMSSLAESEVFKLAHDAEGFIRKPFRPSEVADKLLGLLQKRERKGTP